MMYNTNDQLDHDTQLQLEMHVQTYLMLGLIKHALEAATYGEVIRRALQLYSLRDVDLSATPAEWEPNTRSEQGIKRLHVRIPPRTRMMLDEYRDAKRVSYSVIVTEALLLLAQVLRNQGRLQEGSDTESELDTNTGMKSDDELLTA